MDEETNRTITLGDREICVIEYPHKLSHDEIEGITAKMQNAVGDCLVLDGGAHLTVVSPKPGGLITVEVNRRLSAEAYEHMLKTVTRILPGWGIEAPVLIVADGVVVSPADEKAMRQHGWIRAPQVDQGVDGTA